MTENPSQARPKTPLPPAPKRVDRGKDEIFKESLSPARVVLCWPRWKVLLGAGLNELRPAVRLLLNMLLTERQSEGELRGGNRGEEAERGGERGDIKRMEMTEWENSKGGGDQWLEARAGRMASGACVWVGKRDTGSHTRRGWGRTRRQRKKEIGDNMREREGGKQADRENKSKLQGLYWVGGGGARGPEQNSLGIASLAN